MDWEELSLEAWGPTGLAICEDADEETRQTIASLLADDWIRLWGDGRYHLTPRGYLGVAKRVAPVPFGNERAQEIAATEQNMLVIALALTPGSCATWLKSFV